MTLKVPHFYAIKLNELALHLFRLENDTHAERCLNRALFVSSPTSTENISKMPSLEDYGHLEEELQKHESRCTASTRTCTSKDEGDVTNEGMLVYRNPVSIRLSPSCDETTIQKTIFFNLGTIYMRLEQYNEARTFFTKALSIQTTTSCTTSTYSEDDTDSFSHEILKDEMIHHNLDYINFMEGVYSEAACSGHSEALRMMLQPKGHCRPDVAICLNPLGIDNLSCTISSTSIDHDENQEEGATGFFTEAPLVASHKVTSCEGSRNKHVAIARNNITRMKATNCELFQDCDDEKNQRLVSSQPKHSGKGKRWISQETGSDFWPFTLVH